jgi:very-short-patch-repair endonuclease
MIPFTTEKFIQKAKNVHRDRFDYSKVDYKNNSTKIIITCCKHREFKQTPQMHLNGQGCPQCKRVKLSKDRSFTIEDFIEKATAIHRHKYSYHLVKYVNAHTKITIECPYHGYFDQLPLNHLKGHGCDRCAHNKLSVLFKDSIQKFIKKADKIHKGKYEYNFASYERANKKITIVCPKHGLFEQTPNKHLMGRGCPHCAESVGESKIRHFLQENSIPFEQQKSFLKCRLIKPLLFDFFLPNSKTIIEFDGIQHFIPIDFKGILTEEQKIELFNKSQLRDKIKTDYCKSSGLSLIRIPYTKIGEIPEILTNTLTKGESDASLCSNN